MVERLETALGVFEESDGSYRVLGLPISRCKAVMQPTRTQGPSRGRVGMISRKVFEDEGQFVASVKIDSSEAPRNSVT